MFKSSMKRAKIVMFCHMKWRIMESLHFILMNINIIKNRQLLRRPFQSVPKYF